MLMSWPIVFGKHFQIFSSCDINISAKKLLFSEHFLFILSCSSLYLYILEKVSCLTCVYDICLCNAFSQFAKNIFCLCVNLVMIFLKILVGGKIEFLWETQKSSHEQFCRKRSCFYKSGKIFQQFREKQKESIQDLIICSHDLSIINIITIIIIEQKNVQNHFESPFCLLIRNFLCK